MRGAGKNYWALALMILAGIVLGSFLATLTANISWLSWLSYGQTFGVQNPIVLDLGVIILTFGLTIKITIASIIGIIIVVRADDCNKNNYDQHQCNDAKYTGTIFVFSLLFGRCIFYIFQYGIGSSRTLLFCRCFYLRPAFLAKEPIVT